MVEVQAVAFVGQKVKADGASIFHCAIGHIGRDEFRTHRQDIPPILDPSFGIAPMPLGGVRDLRQGIYLLWFGSNNLHTEEFSFTAVHFSSSRLRANGLKFVSRS